MKLKFNCEFGGIETTVVFTDHAVERTERGVDLCDIVLSLGDAEEVLFDFPARSGLNRSIIVRDFKRNLSYACDVCVIDVNVEVYVITIYHTARGLRQFPQQPVVVITKDGVKKMTYEEYIHLNLRP